MRSSSSWIRARVAASGIRGRACVTARSGLEGVGREGAVGVLCGVLVATAAGVWGGFAATFLLQAAKGMHTAVRAVQANNRNLIGNLPWQLHLLGYLGL